MGEVQSYDWNMGHYLFFSRMICSLYSLSESGVSPFTLTGWLSTMAVITNGLYDGKFFNRLSEWWCISLTWLGQLSRLQTGQQKKIVKENETRLLWCLMQRRESITRSIVAINITEKRNRNLSYVTIGIDRLISFLRRVIWISTTEF